MLLIFGGLPGVGKTALATGLAREIEAFHLRIDSIEQALSSCNVEVTGPEGYEVAYAVAEDNLRLGRVVVADSVNPIEATRAEWRRVARRAGRPYIEIEIVCSDQVEHRRRVESRLAGDFSQALPTWQQVCERKYEPWEPAMTIDTSGQDTGASVSEVREALKALVRCDPDRGRAAG